MTVADFPCALFVNKNIKLVFIWIFLQTIVLEFLHWAVSSDI